MSRKSQPVAMAIPYRSFREKIRLTNKYLKAYRIEDLGEFLYMERRGN